jgi:uncharacterized membrane protein YdjX (TVP38/TMEM64 family)
MSETIDYESPPPQALAAEKPLLPRIAVGVVLLALIVTALATLHGTELGHRLMEHPRHFAGELRSLTHRRPLLAFAVFIGVYLIASELVLPVWWLQVLGGMGFGLFYGTAICLVASSIGSVLAAVTSRWLAADFFHRKVEPKMQNLRKIDRMLGHNGFLVVMATRLTHFLPFGLTNYAFGILEIPLRDIFIGTILGGIPAAAFYVAVGAGYNPMRNWKFDLIVGGINVFLLIPLVLRYTKPEWFKKWGLE